MFVHNQMGDEDVFLNSCMDDWDAMQVCDAARALEIPQGRPSTAVPHFGWSRYLDGPSATSAGAGHSGDSGFNNKIHCYSILLTFISKFTARL